MLVHRRIFRSIILSKDVYSGLTLFSPVLRERSAFIEVFRHHGGLRYHLSSSSSTEIPRETSNPIISEFAIGAVQYHKDILGWLGQEAKPPDVVSKRNETFTRELAKIQEIAQHNSLPKLDDINQLIYNATSIENMKEIADLFRVYRRFLRPVTYRSTKPFVRVCCKLGYPEMALSMLLDRQNYLLTPSRNCIHLLMLRFGFEATRADYFKNMFVSFALLEEHNIGVSGFSYYALLEGCLKAKTEDALDKAVICADEAFSRGLKLPPSFYMAIMDVYLQRHQPDQAIVWFDRGGYKPSKEMYSKAASAYDALGQSSKAFECRETARLQFQDTARNL